MSAVPSIPAVPVPAATVEVPLGASPVVTNAGPSVRGLVSASDAFMLPELWQVHLYLDAATLVIDGTVYPLRPGTLSLIPPSTGSEYRYDHGRFEYLWAHFDASAGGAGVQVPQVQEAGDALPLLTDLFRLAAAAGPGTAGASAHLWSALWRIAALDEQRSRPERRHPAVTAALDLIETHLADPLEASALARRVGISHNHLTRLFRAQVGQTVVGHIRERRMRQAHYLLRTTTMPVRNVAAAVGIPDLQAFNKTCRREFGVSPRVLRTAPSPTATPPPDAP